MRTVLLTLALSLAAAAPVAVAVGPTTAPAMKSPVPMTAESTGTHIQHLRAMRRQLHGLRDELKAEPIVASDTHRKVALKALEESIDAVNAEVIDLEKKAK